jgi:hypothetical protein
MAFTYHRLGLPIILPDRLEILAGEVRNHCSNDHPNIGNDLFLGVE